MYVGCAQRRGLGETTWMHPCGGGDARATYLGLGALGAEPSTLDLGGYWGSIGMGPDYTPPDQLPGSTVPGSPTSSSWSSIWKQIVPAAAGTGLQIAKDVYGGLRPGTYTTTANKSGTSTTYRVPEGQGLNISSIPPDIGGGSSLVLIGGGLLGLFLLGKMFSGR